MRWSFSAHESFRKCPRQWFFKTVFASPHAKDPFRREAYRLSKLESVQAWRGKIVDTVISDTIIPAITRRRSVTLAEARSAALNLFEAQRVQRMSSNWSGPQRAEADNTFFEVEYRIPLTDEVFSRARREILLAIEHFYNARLVWSLLRQAYGLFPQRTLTFRHGEVSVQVRPDLLLFRPGVAPVVFDWKVNTNPLRDYWLQLVTGAIAITRCKPHRDWPAGGVRHAPHEIELIEVQLLMGHVRVHKISPADVEDAEDFISISAGQMQFACGGVESGLPTPEDLPVASDPMTCQTCQFRKLCWGSV